MPPPPPDAPPLPPGFTFLGELGRGGFGRVARVRRLSDGAVLALKQVEGGDRVRALRELDAALRLEHPHILRCLETGAEETRAWMLLEVADHTLEPYLDDPARRQDAWRWLCEAGLGLAHLHRQGFVHRDVKPGNVFVVGGVGKIGDLGLIRGGDYQTLTGTGIVLGTPGYLAPEQVRGEKAGPAADLFALAVCFYRLLEGRLPYSSEGFTEMVLEVARGQLLPLDRARHQLSPAASTLLAQGLEPEPRQRPASIGAWAEALREAGCRPEGPPLRERGGTTRVVDAGLSSRAPPVASPAPPPSRGPRAVALCLGVALLVGLGWSLRPDPPPPPPPPPSPEATPAPLASPFSRDFPERLVELRRRVLGELDALEGGEALRYRDPRLWSQHLVEWRETAEFLAWAREGGRPEELAAELREALRRLDRELLAARLPGPFHPFLGARAAPGRVRVEEHLPPEFLVHVPPHQLAVHPEYAAGWVAAGLRAGDEALRRHRQLQVSIEALLQGRPVAEIPAELRESPTQALSRALGAGGSTMPYTTWAQAHSIWPRPRMLLQELLEPGVRALQETLYCLARADDEHAAAGELGALLARGYVAACPLFWITRLGFTPPEVMLGRDPRSPASHLLRLRILRAQERERLGLGLDLGSIREDLLESGRRASAPATAPLGRERFTTAAAWTLDRLAEFEGARAAMTFFQARRAAIDDLLPQPRGMILTFLIEALEQHARPERDLSPEELSDLRRGLDAVDAGGGFPRHVPDQEARLAHMRQLLALWTSAPAATPETRTLDPR